MRSKLGYFNVDPLLTIPKRTSILNANGSAFASDDDKSAGKVTSEQVTLPQDGIVLQTFIAKWAGSLSTWPKHLDLARDSGYNMWHFPPLQVRGDSNSPYSLADQLDFAPDLFDAQSGASGTRAERFGTVERWLQRIRKEWGILSMTDIVLNHTANNTPWLYEHPEAAYNPLNSPHLVPAEELDRHLHQLSDSLASRGLPTDIQSQADVDAIINVVESETLKKLDLWQYYVLDVASLVNAFETAWKQTAGSSSGPLSVIGEESLDGKTLADAPALLTKYALRNRLALSSRYATQVDIPLSIALLRTLSSAQEEDAEVFRAFRAALDEINAPLYQLYDEDVKAIVSNLKGRLAFQRLDPHGPKLGKITSK